MRSPCSLVALAPKTKPFEALTLIQTGKSELLPLVLIDRPGGDYWKSWDYYVRNPHTRPRAD